MAETIKMITAALELAKLILKKLARRSNTLKVQPESSPTQAATEQYSQPWAPSLSPENNETTNLKAQSSAADIQNIANSIMGTPPYSRQHVMAQYRGREVDWVLELNSISDTPAGLQAVFHVGGFTIFTLVPDHAGPLLKPAREGDLFHVTGRIQDIISIRAIRLQDATFTAFQD